jgi:hypothetical protein
MNEEIWKEIEGYENYYVSNLGRVKVVKYLSLQKNSSGYFGVKVGVKPNVRRLSVARMVAQAFIPNPKNLPQVNHISGKKTDNHVENLEWATASENCKHAWNIGLQTSEDHRGERHGRHILNEKQVRVIKHLRNVKNKMTLKQIADVFRVNVPAIQKIYKGTNWKHVVIPEISK